MKVLWLTGELAAEGLHGVQAFGILVLFKLVSASEPLRALRGVTCTARGNA